MVGQEQAEAYSKSNLPPLHVLLAFRELPHEEPEQATQGHRRSHRCCSHQSPRARLRVR